MIKSKVEKIIKELTPQAIKKEIKIIKKLKLPPKIQKWVQEYEKVGERKEFTWKLFLGARQELGCTSVLKTYQKSLQEVKFLLAMFIILLDDIADQKHNSKLLNKLLKIPFQNNNINFDNLSQKEKTYLSFTLKVWRQINSSIQKYPKYKEFKDIFKYDIKQTINAIEYDYLISNNHFLINKTEYWLYAPHTMQFVFDNPVDWMTLSSFNSNEIGPTRMIIWQAQKMARIGNWISTWEKELKEKDFSSGVFAYAIDLGIITIEDLDDLDNPLIIKKIKESKIENKLLEEWNIYYKEISVLDKRTKIINTKKLLKGLQSLLVLELTSRGYK